VSSVTQLRQLITDRCLTQGNLFQDSVCSVEVVVHNDEIVNAGFFGIIDLLDREGETSLDGRIGLCPSTQQTRTKGGDAWRGDENVDWFESGLFYLTNALICIIYNFLLLLLLFLPKSSTDLCINVQNTPSSTFLHLTNGFEAGAIIIARKLSMLYESRVLQELLELVDGDEVVVFSMSLAGSRRASGVLILS
jgi:hypothetical protein